MNYEYLMVLLLQLLMNYEYPYNGILNIYEL